MFPDIKLPENPMSCECGTLTPYFTTTVNLNDPHAAEVVPICPQCVAKRVETLIREQIVKGTFPSPNRPERVRMLWPQPFQINNVLFHMTGGTVQLNIRHVMHYRTSHAPEPLLIQCDSLNLEDEFEMIERIILVEETEDAIAQLKELIVTDLSAYDEYREI